MAEVNGHLRGTFQTFELDVSRFSDKEIARMYQTKVSPTLNCGVPATALTGEKMLRKGADIGNQVSQNAGIFLPLPIDNYIKIVCGIPEHGRYSDDFYALSKDKQPLVDRWTPSGHSARRRALSLTNTRPGSAGCPMNTGTCRCVIP